MHKAWHVKGPTSSTTAARAGNEQVGMRAPGSEQGKRGASMGTPANRMHAATVLGALEQLAAWSWCSRIEI